MGGYVQLTRIIGTLFKMILKVWAYSGLVLVFCFLLYYVYGGVFAVILLFFALTGNQVKSVWLSVLLQWDVSGVLYHVQDNFLFYPELPSHSRVYVPIPSTFGLPYESVQTRGSDGVLIHMYFIHQPKERQRLSPTIIFFHGNAGNMGHRLQNCRGLYHNLHCNILLGRCVTFLLKYLHTLVSVEYRGYGLSEGNPTEEGLYIDAKASLDYIFSRSDINHSEVIIFGRSLGIN